LDKWRLAAASKGFASAEQVNRLKQRCFPAAIFSNYQIKSRGRLKRSRVQVA